MKSSYKILALAVVSAALLFQNTAYARKSGSGKSAGADYRSAKSGQYVKKSYAQRNQNTTVRERKSKR